MDTVDPKTKTDVELKAIWLDEILIIENHQRNIQLIRDELFRRSTLSKA